LLENGTGFDPRRQRRVEYFAVSNNVSRFPPRKSEAAPADAASGSSGAKRPSRPFPWEGGSAEVGSFGDWLRRQREMREINLRDIADRTKISLRYLEAMEADRFDLLPAPIFAKGFLREYARYVGLSPDDVVNHYLSVHHPEELPGDPKEDTKVRSRPKPVDPGQPPVRRNWRSGALHRRGGAPGAGVGRRLVRRPPQRQAGERRAGAADRRAASRGGQGRAASAAGAEGAARGLARLHQGLLGGGRDRQ
jgi:transcriptional regulator with XRE-family HTH domain